MVLHVLSCQLFFPRCPPWYDDGVLTALDWWDLSRQQSDGLESAVRGMLRWSVHLEGGPRRVNHAAVAVGHKVYSFGGYCSGEDYETLRQIDVHIFNTGWWPIYSYCIKMALSTCLRLNCLKELGLH